MKEMYLIRPQETHCLVNIIKVKNKGGVWRYTAPPSWLMPSSNGLRKAPAEGKLMETSR